MVRRKRLWCGVPTSVLSRPCALARAPPPTALEATTATRRRRATVATAVVAQRRRCHCTDCGHIHSRSCWGSGRWARRERRSTRAGKGTGDSRQAPPGSGRGRAAIVEGEMAGAHSGPRGTVFSIDGQQRSMAAMALQRVRRIACRSRSSDQSHTGSTRRARSSPSTRCGARPGMAAVVPDLPSPHPATRRTSGPIACLPHRSKRPIACPTRWTRLAGAIGDGHKEGGGARIVCLIALREREKRAR